MELPVRTVCVDEQARATPRKARVTGFRPTLAQVDVRILGVLALHGFSGALVKVPSSRRSPQHHISMVSNFNICFARFLRSLSWSDSASESWLTIFRPQVAQ